jgi:hypothetical protein
MLKRREKSSAGKSAKPERSYPYDCQATHPSCATQPASSPRVCCDRITGAAAPELSAHLTVTERALVAAQLTGPSARWTVTVKLPLAVCPAPADQGTASRSGNANPISRTPWVSRRHGARTFTSVDEGNLPCVACVTGRERSSLVASHVRAYHEAVLLCRTVSAAGAGGTSRRNGPWHSRTCCRDRGDCECVSQTSNHAYCSLRTGSRRRDGGGARSANGVHEPDGYRAGPLRALVHDGCGSAHRSVGKWNICAEADVARRCFYATHRRQGNAYRESAGVHRLCESGTAERQ